MQDANSGVQTGSTPARDPSRRPAATCSDLLRQHLRGQTPAVAVRTPRPPGRWALGLDARPRPRGRTRCQRPRRAHRRHRPRRHRHAQRRARTPHRQRSAAQHGRGGVRVRSRFRLHLGQPRLHPHDRLQRRRSDRPRHRTARQCAARSRVLPPDALPPGTRRPLVGRDLAAAQGRPGVPVLGAGQRRARRRPGSAATTSPCSATSPTRSAPSRNCATSPTTTR